MDIYLSRHAPQAGDMVHAGNGHALTIIMPLMVTSIGIDEVRSAYGAMLNPHRLFPSTLTLEKKIPRSMLLV